MKTTETTTAAQTAATSAYYQFNNDTVS